MVSHTYLFRLLSHTRALVNVPLIVVELRQHLDSVFIVQAQHTTVLWEQVVSKLRTVCAADSDSTRSSYKTSAGIGCCSNRRHFNKVLSMQ